ncbi:MAG: response regulator [Bacteroidota bacterium]
MPSILIVDDEPSIAMSLEFLMEQAGYDVRVARDGEAALAAARERLPDLALLDVMLPDTTGVAVCRALRGLPGGEAVRVLMVSAKGRDVDVERGLAAGADGYVTKPFAIQDVIDRVAQLLDP